MCVNNINVVIIGWGGGKTVEVMFPRCIRSMVGCLVFVLMFMLNIPSLLSRFFVLGAGLSHTQSCSFSHLVMVI